MATLEEVTLRQELRDLEQSVNELAQSLAALATYVHRNDEPELCDFTITRHVRVRNAEEAVIVAESIEGAVDGHLGEYTIQAGNRVGLGGGTVRSGG